MIILDRLIKELEQLAEDANYQSVTHQDFNDLSEHYLGYSEGVYKAIELINDYLKRRDV